MVKLNTWGFYKIYTDDNLKKNAKFDIEITSKYLYVSYSSSISATHLLYAGGGL